MSENSLQLHTGATLVERTALATILTPPATETFVPIPHDVLLGQSEAALREVGLVITGERHGLNRDGMEYFGILDVERAGNGHEDKGYIRTVGIRNSHNKRFPAIVGAGSRVFVCDNLAFSAEIQIMRKHTSRILKDLPQLVARAIGMLASKWIDQDKRFDAYKAYELSTEQAHDLVIRTMDFGVIGATYVPKILEEYRNPKHEEFGARTLWSMFNSFTEVLKASNVFTLPKRTQALHALFDQRSGLTIDITAEKDALGAVAEEAGAEIRIQ